MKSLLCCIFFCLVAVTGSAQERFSKCTSELSLSEKNTKSLSVSLAGIGVITIWGALKWDYFSQSPHAGSEGWFANTTKEGGADKLGHLYSSYVISHALSSLYENWCFEKENAALYGSLSSFAIMGYMEVGDSFSEYGFSYEDMIANFLGCAAGYLLYKYPDLAGKFSLRWEYGFKPNGTDFLTDYDNSKYLLAVKLNGFESVNKTFLKHFELHMGYYARGFSDDKDQKERNFYLGIGLNLTDLFHRYSWKKTAVVLDYIQIPGTYLQYKHDFNEN